VVDLSLRGGRLARHRAVRQDSLVTFMVVTARGAEADKVRGLAMAPTTTSQALSFPELIARVAAALRRDPRVRRRAREAATLEHPGIRIEGGATGSRSTSGRST